MKNGATQLPLGPSVSYSRQYRRCGKPNCPACSEGERGHGPYWYAFWWEEGRKRSRYLGKDTPVAVQASAATGSALWAAGQRRAASLQVRTLGAFSVWLDGALVPPKRWRRRSVAALFKCLLSAPGQRMLREQLIDALLPESELAGGAKALRSATHLLRKILDRPGAAISHLCSDGDWLALVPRLDSEPSADWLDAMAFERAADAALAGPQTETCRAALALYQGDYLPDDRYEDWAERRRAELQGRHIALLLHLATLYQEEGAVEEALRCLRGVLAGDATNEDAARGLMRALAAEGRYGEAFQVYRDLSAALREELDEQPAVETRALRAALLKALPAPTLAPLRKDNLPAATTSFVGRERERTEVLQALRSGSGGSRLLTLVGAGGCGKTRLALEAARVLVEDYPDGAWLVELAPLASAVSGGASHVPEAVAAALGLRTDPGRPTLQALATNLAAKRMLLLLDNCEHLIDACATLVSTLLAAAPNVQILATSQAPLGVLGEFCLRIPPLSLPEARHSYTVADLDSCDAIQLFVERAATARPTFALTSHNAGAVARICRQLDGIPLAIELAAVRLASLPLESLEARLVDRFRLLTGGNRAALPRQQTLQATLDWSYSLLGGAEQQLLRRLSVFAGGWDLAAAEAIVGEEGTDDWELLDEMQSLVAKSLVQLDDAAEAPRFRLLETVRHYVQRHLEASGEAPAIRDRHMQWYLVLAEASREALRGPDQALAGSRLELERDNMSAALQWAQRRQAQSLGLRLAVALRRHWEMRGRLTEGREWLEALLALDAAEAQQATLPQLAQAFNACGLLAFGQGDYRRATALHEQSLTLHRQLEDMEGTAATLNNLGNVAVRLGDYPRASALYQECLVLFQSLENDGAVATVLNNLGSVASDQGDHVRATQLYNESLTLRRRLQDTSGIAASLTNLGHLAFTRGDLTLAEVLLAEGLSLKRDLGDAGGISESLRMLARVALAGADQSRALDLYRESFALCRQADDVWGSAASLQGLAEVCVSLSHFERTAMLCSIADTLRQTIGAALTPAERDTYQRVTGLARHALGEAVFAAVWARAQILTPETAVAQAFDAPAP